MPKKPNTRDWQAVERDGALNEGRVLAYARLMDADLRAVFPEQTVTVLTMPEPDTP